MDQVARQRELVRQRIARTLPDTDFQDVVLLAAQLCHTGVAAISILDGDRQWFRAMVGAQWPAEPRSQSFCAHAVRAPSELLEVRDARADPRFAQNVLVTGASAIRFYAGLPLTVSGATIGTLCVLDPHVRHLSSAQRSGLHALARLTMALIEARLQSPEAPRALPPAPPVALLRSNFRVVILEVQELDQARLRLGERRLERFLQVLQERLEEAMRADSPDTVDRVAGSGEIIALLHGDETADPMRKLLSIVPGLLRGSGLRVLAGSAASRAPTDTLTEVFIRADQALARTRKATVGQEAAA